MPKKRLHNTSSQRNILPTLEDLTVHDIANNEVKIKCLKKGAFNGAINRERHNLERFSDDDEDDGDMDTSEGFSPRTGCKRKRRRKYDSLKTSSGSRVFHIDIWELIGDHIRPEDVGLFASLCYTSCEVVSTARFWRSMYNRFCLHNSANLPEDLQSHHWDSKKVEGLRTRTVRSLFLCYEPLKRRLANARAGDHFPIKSQINGNKIMRGKILSYKHMRKGKNHLYVFKVFQRDTVPNQALFGQDTQFLDFIGPLSTQTVACQHDDDGCYLLEVICSDYCRIGCEVYSKCINMICETPAEVTNNKMNKMTLSLTPYVSYGSYRNAWHNVGYKPIGWNEVTKVVLQPVQRWRVLPWWHPEFVTVLYDDKSDDLRCDDPSQPDFS